MMPRPPAGGDELVRRGAEIGLLQSFVDRAGRAGEALVLVGDVGVGKTALLDFVARRADSLGRASLLIQVQSYPGRWSGHLTQDKAAGAAQTVRTVQRLMKASLHDH